MSGRLQQVDGSVTTAGSEPGPSATPDPSKPAAIVTGAAGGIGRAITERLLADGFAVTAVDAKADPDGPGDPLSADLRSPEENRRVVDATLARYGRLDVVVAGAGLQHVSPIADFDEERWNELIGVMLTSPFLLARYAWPFLEQSEQARFIVIASVHSLVASPFKAAYVAAKHGVLGLVKVLALEGAEAGISAVAVCPGYVRTPLVEKQIDAQAQAHGIDPEEVIEQVLLAPHAIKRLLEPTEVADVVSVLAGPLGDSFTGTPVTMDLGWSAP